MKHHNQTISFNQFFFIFTAKKQLQWNGTGSYQLIKWYHQCFLHQVESTAHHRRHHYYSS